MKFGTLLLNNKIYDLDYMKKSELEELLKNNYQYKNNEYMKAKQLCEQNNSNEISSFDENISNEFKTFLDNSSIYVKSEAIIQRALVDKLSYNIIKEKLNNKRNAISASIKKINPKYNSVSNKKGEEIQKEISSLMKRYETVLKELADFFDTKIEQLILKKLELEANLIGSIINDEYLINEEAKRKDDKENDKLLANLSNSVKNIIAKLTKKKEEKVIDVAMISKLQDKEDIEHEHEEKLQNMIEMIKQSRNNNLNKISEFEAEILSIDKEINRLNENKEKAILDAIESSSKEMIIQKNSVSVLGKIKLFFKSKLNSKKAIYEEIIIPLEKSIQNYEENDLESIKR